MHALESTDTPGLYKRKGTFWCRIQVGKKTRERSLRTTSKNAAIETMSRWRREMGITAARSAHAGGNDKRDTIGWWLVRLRHKYRRDPQTSAKHKLFIAERVQAIKASWPALLKMRPDAATPTQIGVWMDAQLAGRGQKAKSPRTVSGNMLVLELALDLAVAAGTLTVNPLEGIKKARPSKQMFSKKHQISPETFDTILDSTRKKPGFARQGADLAELMASTGMRIGEANLLTWANVDWGRRELVAHNGKGRIRSGTQNDVKRLLGWRLCFAASGAMGKSLIRGLRRCRSVVAPWNRLARPQAYPNSHNTICDTFSRRGVSKPALIFRLSPRGLVTGMGGHC